MFLQDARTSYNECNPRENDTQTPECAFLRNIVMKVKNFGVMSFENIGIPRRESQGHTQGRVPGAYPGEGPRGIPREGSQGHTQGRVSKAYPREGSLGAGPSLGSLIRIENRILTKKSRMEQSIPV